MSTSTAQVATSSCLEAFGALRAQRQAAKPDLAAQVSDVEIEDEFGRFRLWAANIGAISRGHGSLDYRLRDAPVVLEGVLKLLDELRQELHQSMYPRPKYIATFLNWKKCALSCLAQDSHTKRKYLQVRAMWMTRTRPHCQAIASRALTAPRTVMMRNQLLVSCADEYLRYQILMTTFIACLVQYERRHRTLDHLKHCLIS